MSSEAKNDLGIYFHKKYVNNRKVSFYYVAKDVNSVPDRPSDKDEWKAFLQDNRIGRNTRKRAHETSLRVAVVSPVPPDDEDVSLDDEDVSPDEEDDGEQHDRARQQAGSFWEDKRICKLFNSSDVENTLYSWIKKLIVVDESELEKMVNKTEEHPVEKNMCLTYRGR